jgi:hypothetical protein
VILPGPLHGPLTIKLTIVANVGVAIKRVGFAIKRQYRKAVGYLYWIDFTMGFGRGQLPPPGAACADYWIGP